jgi:hypothetical protein
MTIEADLDYVESSKACPKPHEPELEILSKRKEEWQGAKSK